MDVLSTGIPQRVYSSRKPVESMPAHLSPSSNTIIQHHHGPPKEREERGEREREDAEVVVKGERRRACESWVWSESNGPQRVGYK
jgi:hypothetical protein